MIILLLMNIGGITPPVGMNSYVIANVVKDVPVTKIFRYSAPYVISNAIVIIILIIFPGIATWLPAILYN